MKTGVHSHVLTSCITGCSHRLLCAPAQTMTSFTKTLAHLRKQIPSGAACPYGGPPADASCLLYGVLLTHLPACCSFLPAPSVHCFGTPPLVTQGAFLVPLRHHISPVAVTPPNAAAATRTMNDTILEPRGAPGATTNQHRWTRLLAALPEVGTGGGGMGCTYLVFSSSSRTPFEPSQSGCLGNRLGPSASFPTLPPYPGVVP